MPGGVTGRTLLVPDMEPFGARLLAASFRAFGVDARVMPTWEGLTVGKEFTSGKECLPCQVTLGDILHHLRSEEQRLRSLFDASRYAYFLPGASGPCRFGMYGRLQRMVLDRFPAFRAVSIVTLTTDDAYSAGGLLPSGTAGRFKKLAFVATVAADLLDRMVWRVRPYERQAGTVDAAAEEALAALERFVEERGSSLPFGAIGDLLASAAGRIADLRDDRLPQRPLVAVIGEIYLRSHPDSNQNLLRRLEEYGAEVVNASLAEWVVYVSWERRRELARAFRGSFRHGRWRRSARAAARWAGQAAEYAWLLGRQRRLYRRVRDRLEVRSEHAIGEVAERLRRDPLFSFDVGTEAVLSIGGALLSADHGADGVVNVFPFTCMPGTIASSILNPALRARGVPFIDVPCDGGSQPNREAALRTFVHQARQHLEAAGPAQGRR